MSASDRDFALERYKYILDQKKTLNEVSFKVVGLYQAGLGLILAGFFQVATRVVAGDITSSASASVLDGLAVALVLLSAFALLMLLSGITSWIGYRRDEAVLEATYLGGSRPLPSVWSIFKWYETYIALAVISSTVAVAVYFHAVRLELGI